MKVELEVDKQGSKEKLGRRIKRFYYHFGRFIGIFNVFNNVTDNFVKLRAFIIITKVDFFEGIEIIIEIIIIFLNFLYDCFNKEKSSLFNKSVFSMNKKNCVTALETKGISSPNLLKRRLLITAAWKLSLALQN